MNTTTKIAAGVAALLLIGTTGFALHGRGESIAAVPVNKELKEGVIAAPGRVEAVSEEVRVSSELSGRLKRVNVEEGDRVKRGDVLAELENSDFRARVASSEATLALRESELRRIVNGSRTEERREADAAKQAAKAVLENAQSETDRRRNLAAKGVISRDEADRFERAYRVAQAEYDQASQHFALVDADAREEDRSKAEANVAEARALVEEARAVYEKSLIRAPINGVILRKLRRAGESVSTQFDSPVITMADDSVLRVRLDVDETDVAKLQVGQRAYVTAEAFGEQKFEGKVIRVGRILGKKNVRTDEPTEHVDTKILETLVELNPGERLPLGLRVDSFVETR